jgi:CheY-like chemotaxis protein
VLFNLAGNAIKFTDRGGVSIIVEPDTQPDAVAISVRDTGIGISADDQARIFAEFEQADGGSARKYGGTGLGLTISKRIIESMGGTIAIESIPGAGATFRVSIPLARFGDTDEPGLPVPDLAGHDVLIVAPAAIEASLIARRLQRWGARTAIVPDDEVASALLPERPWSAVLVDHAPGTAQSEVLARLAATVESFLAARAAGTPYDRVLMDLHMPGMDGIRGHAPHQSHRGRAGGAAHADPRANRERLRRGSRCLPCRGHGRLPGQTARPRASQRRARRRRRRAGGVRIFRFRSGALSRTHQRGRQRFRFALPGGRD